MFSGLGVNPPTMEFDTPDAEMRSSRGTPRAEDALTLRTLEGRSAVGTPDRTGNETNQEDHEASEGEDEAEVNHATLVSFDVEATESVDAANGSWSAELRSANDSRQPKIAKYRVSGITLLPTIMATEGIKELASSVIALPLEYVMVRVRSSQLFCPRSYAESCPPQAIARAYGRKGVLALSLSDFSQRNAPVLSAFAIQFICTGVVWAGFTAAVYWKATRSRKIMEEKTTRYDQT